MRSIAFYSVVSSVLLCTALLPCAPAFSQSTDFSRPTAITTIPLVGEHDGANNVSYYYSFEAGPGNVLITFDGHATKYSSSAQAKVSDINRNSLGELYLVAQTQPSSTTKTIKLAKRQKLVIELAFHEDTSMGVLKYSVNMSGPVQIAKAPPAANNASLPSPREVPLRSNNGTLTIELKDGSVNEIDLSTVKKIVVND